MSTNQQSSAKSSSNATDSKGAHGRDNNKTKRKNNNKKGNNQANSQSNKFKGNLPQRGPYQLFNVMETELANFASSKRD